MDKLARSRESFILTSILDISALLSGFQTCDSLPKLCRFASAQRNNHTTYGEWCGGPDRNGLWFDPASRFHTEARAKFSTIPFAEVWASLQSSLGLLFSHSDKSHVYIYIYICITPQKRCKERESQRDYAGATGIMIQIQAFNSSTGVAGGGFHIMAQPTHLRGSIALPYGNRTLVRCLPTPSQISHELLQTVLVSPSRSVPRVRICGSCILELDGTPVAYHTQHWRWQCCQAVSTPSLTTQISL